MCQHVHWKHGYWQQLGARERSELRQSSARWRPTRKTARSGFLLTSVRIMRMRSKRQQRNLASRLYYAWIPLMKSQFSMMPMLRNNIFEAMPGRQGFNTGL
jgi:hypothetical protein